MKKYIYISLTVIFSIILFYLYYNLITKEDGWVLGDWLINYQDSGFKRRGLLGTVFVFLYDTLNLNIPKQVFVIATFLWLNFLLFLYTQISKIKVNIFGIILLLFNTTSLFFNAVSTESIGRKEIILFNIFLLYTVYYDKLHYKWRTLIFGMLLLLVSFIHELTFFYIGYFILFDRIANKAKKVNVFSTFIYVSAVFIPVFLFYMFGGNINSGHSLEFLKTKGINLTNGIFNHHENYNTLQHYKIYFTGYLKYVIPLMIAYGSIFYFVRIYGPNYRIILKNFTINLLFSLPLFYLATDWGRWLNIHMILSTIGAIYLMTKEENKTEITKNQKFKIIVWVLLCAFIQTAVCCNGAKLNYFLEILLSKIS